MKIKDWKDDKASSLFKIQGGNAFKSSDSKDSGIRWLKIANVGFEKIVWNEKSFLPSDFLVKYPEVLLKKGDIVMSLTRPVLSGRLKIAKISKSDSPALLNQRVGRLVLKENVDSEFLYQSLLQKRISYAIEQNLQGTDPPNLSMNTFDNIYIPLPPLPEQKAIAETLALWDEAIAKLERLITLKEMRFQWLLQELIGKKIKEAEKKENGWKKVKLGDVVLICYGKDQKKIEDESGENNIYGTGGIIGKTNKYLYDQPSVLIGRKGTIDKPRYVEKPFWTVDTLFYTKISDRLIPKFFYYYLFNLNLKSYSEASGVPSLTTSTLNNIELYIPDFIIQLDIKNFLTLQDKEISQIRILKEMIESQKQGLMQKLLTGKWRVVV